MKLNIHTKQSYAESYFNLSLLTSVDLDWRNSALKSAVKNKHRDLSNQAFQINKMHLCKRQETLSRGLIPMCLEI